MDYTISRSLERNISHMSSYESFSFEHSELMGKLITSTNLADKR